MNAAPHLRPVEEADYEWLRRLYHQVRAAEFAILPPEQREMLLDSQFMIQERAYAMQYPGIAVLVIEWGGEPVGRLLLHRDGAAWRVVDLAVADAARGRGIGAAVLVQVQAMAAAAGPGACVLLSVRPGNPARRLYDRLGFREAPGGVEGVTVPMFWRSGPASGAGFQTLCAGDTPP